MKKVIAMIVALAAVMSLAACGGDTDTTSSTTSTGGTSTTGSTSQTSSVQSIVPIIPPVSSEPEEEEIDNLAMSDGATPIDMNTGKTESDEGYKKYYQGDAGLHSLDLAFNGNDADGWQMHGDNKATDDGAVWLGVEFAEATSVDMIVVKFESGSAPTTYEDGAYRVEYSVDGTEWLAIESPEVVRTTDTATVDAVSFEAIEVKAVRVVLLTNSTYENGKYAPKVQEFEVYGPVAEEGETSEATSDTIAE